MDDQNTQQIKKTPFTEGKRLVDQSLVHSQITEKTQTMINTPMVDDTGVDEKDQAFIEMVLKMIDEGKINLFTPDTLLNTHVYEKLDYKAQGTADVNAISLLADLRQIKKLKEQGYDKSFQIQNLIHHVRVTKERLEEECGDIYII
jgi:hypothetical protein